MARSIAGGLAEGIANFYATREAFRRQREEDDKRDKLQRYAPYYAARDRADFTTIAAMTPDMIPEEERGLDFAGMAAKQKAEEDRRKAVELYVKIKSQLPNADIAAPAGMEALGITENTFRAPYEEARREKWLAGLAPGERADAERMVPFDKANPGAWETILEDLRAPRDVSVPRFDLVAPEASGRAGLISGAGELGKPRMSPLEGMDVATRMEVARKPGLRFETAEEWALAEKNKVSPVDMAELAVKLGQTFETPIAMNLLQSAGGDPKLLSGGKSRWEATETGKNDRFAQAMSERQKRATVQTAGKYLGMLFDRKLDGATAATLGPQMWRDLIEQGVLDPASPQPDWSEVANSLTPGQRMSAFNAALARGLSQARFQFDIDKYLANSEDPDASYTPYVPPPPVPGFNAPRGLPAPPGYGAPGGTLVMSAPDRGSSSGASVKVTSLPAKKTPEKKSSEKLPAQMTPGNRDKARALGFSEAAIKYGPAEVLKNIAYYERQGWLNESGKLYPESAKNVSSRVKTVNDRYAAKYGGKGGSSSGTSSARGKIQAAIKANPAIKRQVEAARKNGYSDEEIAEGL